MPNRASIFGDCAKVLLRIYTAAEGEEIKQMTQAVTEARKCTLAIIGEIAGACEDDTESVIAKHVESVLSDLHPDVRYTVDGKLIAEKLVRDLAEICATFRSIELGIERRSKERFLEAKVFCDHMKDELGHLPK